MRAAPYSMLERWLHWLALEPTAVRELSFDLERQHSRERVRAGAAGAVHICGLARSGTTVLLRALARSPAFRTLTYRDMPFVLAPRLWQRVSSRMARSIPAGERAHGDGILVDLDSPEAFEEVFWRTFCAQSPGDRGYGTAQPKAEALAAFAEYRAIVADGRRYLSKNNNNLVRLDALARDRSATLLVVYREPVAVARSLLRQHRRFSAAQREAPFTRAYMGWLGHHEFGLDHKPYSFALESMDPSLAPADPDYWIDYWDAVHREILRHEHVHLVDHDRLCQEPVAVFGAIVDLLGIDADPALLASEIRKPSAERAAPDAFRPACLERASRTHGELRASRRNVHR